MGDIEDLERQPAAGVMAAFGVHLWQDGDREVLNDREEFSSDWSAMGSIAEKLGITPETCLCVGSSG